MNEAEIKCIIIEELENIGILVDKTESDIDLVSINMDSIMFVSFIVSLEEKLNIRFPDECLTMETLSSLNGFAQLIYTVLLKD